MKVDLIISKARADGRELLMEDEAKEIISSLGIPVTHCLVARDEKEALLQAEKIGYPVVLKVRSPKIVHKSDYKGVVLDIKNKKELRAAYREITFRAAVLDGEAAVTVQAMAAKGLETLIGATVNKQFGPVIAFGLGGVFTEIVNDVSFRLAPVDPGEAGRMISQIKGCRLLQGYRGSPAVDTGALAEAISRVSNLVFEYKEFAEIDLNPVAAYPDGVLVLDARMRLKIGEMPANTR
ncbi:MAG TPA: acetate--CoA ligase family protein [Bacillota bacterium]|nr:acetate--CoA ligase family protein [Bacillota bacterium]